VRKRRNRELQALALRLAEARVRPKLGRRLEVLVESFRGGRAYGHTPDYYEAEFTGPARVGQTVWVRVEAIAGYTLQGRLEAVKEEPARLGLPVL